MNNQLTHGLCRMFTNKIWYTETQDQYVPDLPEGYIFLGDAQGKAYKSSKLIDIKRSIHWINENIVDLQTRMGTAEDNIVDLQTRMNTAETNIADLQTRMNTAESDISHHSTQIQCIIDALTPIEPAVAACSV